MDLLLYTILFLIFVCMVCFIHSDFLKLEKEEGKEEEYDGYTGIIKFDEELSKMLKQIRSGKIKLPTPYFGYGAEEENKKSMTYKIGDRVKVKIAEGVEQYGKVIKEEENGQSLTVLFQNGNYDLFLCEDLTPITDPMDCLMVGDIIKSKNGTERKVLGINGEVHLLSYEQNKNVFQDSWTMFELKRDGYNFSQPTSTKIQEAYDLLVREGKIVDGKIIK